MENKENFPSQEQIDALIYFAQYLNSSRYPEISNLEPTETPFLTTILELKIKSLRTLLFEILAHIQSLSTLERSLLSYLAGC